MRKFSAGVLVVTLTGCAFIEAAQSTRQATCAMGDYTRFGAAARAYGDIFDLIKMQKSLVLWCSRKTRMRNSSI